MHTYHVCAAVPYGSNWSRIPYLALRFLQRKAELRWSGIRIKNSPAECNCSPAPLISFKMELLLCCVRVCVCMHVGVCVCGCVHVCVWVGECKKRKWGRVRDRNPEEYWPYGTLDITSLNKRLMPQAHRGRAEKMETDRKTFFTFRMTLCAIIREI